MMEDDHKQDTQDLVGELIRRAGRRERPSADEHDRVLAAATDAFHAKVRQRRRRVMLRSIAAAVLVGIATAQIISNLPFAPSQPLAYLDRVIGPAEVQEGNEKWSVLTGESSPLFTASRIRTGPDSRLGVRMVNGVSLRLAESTDVIFAAPDRVRLVTGKVYADAGEYPASGGATARRIMVETAAGLAWDVGTQFEVRYVNDNYRLRVREGEVSLQQDSRELRSMAGEQLIIDASQRVRRDRISGDDLDWQWTESVAPDPFVDARPVSVLVNWVARQTGRPVEYTRPGLELMAATTILYGQVHHLEPLEVLDAMLATTDFDFTLLEDGTILIDSAR